MRICRRIFGLTLALCVLATAAIATAQDSGIHVRSIRVLATNPEALAMFYEKAFGMAETRRAANSPTLTEIVINSGSTMCAFVKDPDGNQIEMVMTI